LPRAASIYAMSGTQHRSAVPVFAAAHSGSNGAASAHAVAAGAGGPPAVGALPPVGSSRPATLAAVAGVPPWAAPGISKPAKRRVPLTDAQKREICEIAKADPSLSHSGIAKVFEGRHGIRVERSTVTRVVARSGEWLDRPLRTPNAKRRQVSRFPALEAATFEFVRNASFDVGRRKQLTDSRICAFAKSAAAQLGIEDFKASSSWLSALKRRHKLTPSAKKGEENPSKAYDIWVTSPVSENEHILDNFDRLEDIYNLHATVLYYDAGPENVDWNAPAAGNYLGGDSFMDLSDEHRRTLSDGVIDDRADVPSNDAMTGGPGAGIARPGSVASFGAGTPRTGISGVPRSIRDIMNPTSVNDDDGFRRHSVHPSAYLQNARSWREGAPNDADDDDDDDDDDRMDDGLNIQGLDMSRSHGSVAENGLGGGDRVQGCLSGVDHLLGAAGVMPLQTGDGMNAMSSGSLCGSHLPSDHMQPASQFILPAVLREAQFTEDDLRSTLLSSAGPAPISGAIAEDNARQTQSTCGGLGATKSVPSPPPLTRKALTTLLCTNAAGSARIAPWIVGAKGISGPRDELRRPFPGVNVIYEGTERGWLTSKSVMEWLIWFDSTLDRSVLLVTSVLTTSEVSCVSLKYVTVLPVAMWIPRGRSNTFGVGTGTRTPMDAILLKLFRGRYRSATLDRMLQHMEKGICLPEISLRCAAEMIVTAWHGLNAGTVKSAFRASAIVPMRMQSRNRGHSARSVEEDKILFKLGKELQEKMNRYRNAVVGYLFANQLNLNGPNVPPLNCATSERLMTIPGETTVVQPFASDAEIVASVLVAEEDARETGTGLAPAPAWQGAGRTTGVVDGSSAGDAPGAAITPQSMSDVEIASRHDAVVLMEKLLAFCRRPENNDLNNEELMYNASALHVALQKAAAFDAPPVPEPMNDE
jgi:DDE superfamily endonuclease